MCTYVVYPTLVLQFEFVYTRVKMRKNRVLILLIISLCSKNNYKKFQNGRLAVFHEYHLRLLLFKYELSLSFFDDDQEENILNCHKCFSRAVQKYKNVVTHYSRGSNFECWYVFVVGPSYGVKGSMASNEFAKPMVHYIAIL